MVLTLLGIIMDGILVFLHGAMVMIHSGGKVLLILLKALEVIQLEYGYIVTVDRTLYLTKMMVMY